MWLEMGARVRKNLGDASELHKLECSQAMGQENSSTHRATAFIVVAHPDKNSFNHAIAQSVVGRLHRLGISTALRDLYAEEFEPRITASEMRGQATTDPMVIEHIELLRASDILVVIHPNCWGSPPAMMKGWIDRVFAVNAAYAFEKGSDTGDVPKGLLDLKEAFIFNTSNTPIAREEANFGDPLELIWKNCLLHYCGVRNVVRHVFRVIATSTVEERTQWLGEAGDLVEQRLVGWR